MGAEAIPRPRRPLFLLDYDGTLAPLRDRPEDARPHPAVPRILRGLLSAGHPVYVVTGRPVAAIARWLPVPGLGVVGVHGLEEGTVGGPVAVRAGPGVRQRLERVRAALPAIPGVRVEDKGWAFALHWRGLHEVGVAGRLEAALSPLPPGLRLLRGPCTLELLPAGAGKGPAVARLVRRYPDRTPVCAGDGQADEEAFAALPADAVTVRVGPGATRARHRLAGVDDVVAYLAGWLLG